MPKNDLHKSTKFVTYLDSDKLKGPKIQGKDVCHKVKGNSIRTKPNTFLYTCGDNRLRLKLTTFMKEKYDAECNSRKLIEDTKKVFSLHQIRSMIAIYCGSSLIKNVMADDELFRNMLRETIDYIESQQLDDSIKAKSTYLAAKYFNKDINDKNIASYRKDFNKMCKLISAMSGFRINLTSKNTEVNGSLDLTPNKDKMFDETKYNLMSIILDQIKLVSKIPGNSLSRKLDIENLCFRDASK